MDQMTMTYVIAAGTGLFTAGSIFYYTKNKRFLGRSVFTTIASALVFIMCIYGIIKGVSILNVQAMIESMMRK